MNTSYQIEETERQTSKFDYKVEQVQMTLPNGTPTKYIGNVRTDTNEVLGVVTERYAVLQNEALFETAEAIFKSHNFGDFNRKVVCTNGGARIRGIYTFNNYGVKLKNGNDLTFQVKVQNSFDGSLRASFQVGFVRLICTNGLSAPVATIGMTKKHTQHLDIIVADNSFNTAVASFHENHNFFNRMIDVNVSQVDGRQILLNLEKQKIMSERMREDIQSIWESPTYREDEGRNMFNLYNSVTQHLTHNVESKRFELAERVNTGVVNAFTKALKRGGIESLLVTHNHN